tara:strand:- start:90 stop:659 length:570 start_codon:yes stop_codon:yes gene_type:complete
VEDLHFINRSSELNEVYLSSMDTEAMIHFLRGRDYCVEEIWEMKTFANGQFEESQLGWPNEEPSWVRSDHSKELSFLMETFDNHTISILSIKLDDGGYISQSYGEFIIRFGKGKDLKTPTLKVLEMYGYFAAEEIWSLTDQHNIMLPIDSLKGYEAKDINEDDLKAVVRHGQSLIEEHKKLDLSMANDV